jgi:hypothetical protein
MPSHATAQFNSHIRRRQLAGEDVHASDPKFVLEEGVPFIDPLDNPASPAEFPATREQYAPPVSRFAPRTAAEQEQAAAESSARHAADDDEQEEVAPDGDEEEEVDA